MEVNALTRWGSFARDLNQLISHAWSSDQLAAMRGRFSPRTRAVQPPQQQTAVAATGADYEGIEDESSPRAGSRPSYPPLLRLLKYFLKRFAKGFMIGYLIKAVFNLLPYAIRTRLNPFKLKPIFIQKFHHLLGREPISFGAFLGTFLGISEYFLRILSKSPTPLVRVLRAPIAGAFAAFGFLWMPKDQRPAIALFFFVRAVELFIRWACLLRLVPKLENADTWTMVIASAQVLWAWIYQPQALDPGYLRFLNHQGGMPRDIVDSFGGLCEYSSAVGPQNLLNIGSFALSNERRIKSGSPALELMDLSLTDRSSLQPLICQVVHPHDHYCFAFFVRYLIRAYKRALPVYVPVYLIPLVLFKSKTIISAPVKTFISTVMNVAQSSLFLSTYCGSAWYITCILRNYFAGYNGGQFIGLASGLSGLSVLLEKKPRRIELALYVMSHAIKTFLTLNTSNGSLPYVSNTDFLAFVFSSMIIVTVYVEHPEIMRPSYRSLLNYFFGSSKKSMREKHKEHEMDDKVYRQMMAIPESPAVSVSTLKPQDAPPS
eukprot:TRINITY_DN37_c0_g1_i2.p1 TRINITY_DN37_c0_g1~~TRINITY_DN37_c0_g1_i2.p1  ORF type:complete len:545 (-),score=119.88 TRINITY_DN37_c0_g1_i2:949-2583(-)